MPVKAKWQYISGLTGSFLKETMAERDEALGVLDQLSYAGHDDEEIRATTFAIQIAVDGLTRPEQELSALCEECSHIDPKSIKTVESIGLKAQGFADELIDIQRDLPRLNQRAMELIEG